MCKFCLLIAAVGLAGAGGIWFTHGHCSSAGAACDGYVTAPAGEVSGPKCCTLNGEDAVAKDEGGCCSGVQAAAGSDEGKDKEVTLKGTILCAKCALKEKDVKKCTTAIVVKENDKEVIYYLDDQGAKESYHEEVCGGEKKAGLVVGVVATKDGKRWIKPSKVEYEKK